MTNQQKIEASREARLWISTAIGVITTWALISPGSFNQVINKIKDKATVTKERFNEGILLRRTEKETKEESN